MIDELDRATLLARLQETLTLLKSLSTQNATLKAENVSLKRRLKNNKIFAGQDESSPVKADIQVQDRFAAPDMMSKTDKIALFRNLFRGRDDIYPVRWENAKTGKSGYSPAIKNKWEYFEAKKQGGRNVTPDYFPLTDEVIQHHLEGRLVAGVYPLLKDDTCWFLAADFDGDGYREDAQCFLNTSRELGVCAYPECSRSGNGAHIWIFFEQAIPAALARQLGFHILTRSMEARHQIKFRSYDRFFPNQDTLPKGGFGNLIALPLQREAREKEGSVFLDKDLAPVPDQWRLLNTVERLSQAAVERIVESACRAGAIINVPAPAYGDLESDDPWTLPPSRKGKVRPVEGPFPETVRIVRTNLVYIDKSDLSPSLINHLRLLAAFQNPEFFKKQAMRLPVYDKPRVIDCSEDLGKFLALPRGCFEEALALLRRCHVKTEVEDQRFSGQAISTQFLGKLRIEQERAVGKLLEQDIALFSAPTAYGKTVLAAAMIARRGVGTLILVHRQQLIDQWKERLSTFLDLPPKTIGQVGAGKKKTGGVVDVAMIQSLGRQGQVDDLVANYGHIIVDECHHVSAFSFEQVLRACKAKYVLGLTATPRRRDGHHPIIFMQCGPLVNVTQKSTDSDAASPAARSVVIRETAFAIASEIEKPPMHELYQALTDCEDRNKLIATDIERTVRAGGCPLVLTERVEHLDILEKLLQSCPCPKVIFRGGMGKKQRKLAMDQLGAQNGPRIIIATGRYIGEGFDDPLLDTLFLALPISWTGTLQQYVGRLHRTHDSKTKVTVYDYVDSQVPTLARMFKKRSRGYRALGHRIEREHAEQSLACNPV